MPLTLLAILLTFAAPAPFAESAAAQEDEAIVEVSRRTAAPRVVVPVRPPMLPPAPRAIVPADPDVRFRPVVDWTPRLFSRPPPL